MLSGFDRMHQYNCIPLSVRMFKWNASLYDHHHHDLFMLPLSLIYNLNFSNEWVVCDRDPL